MDSNSLFYLKLNFTVRNWEFKIVFYLLWRVCIIKYTRTRWSDGTAQTRKRRFTAHISLHCRTILIVANYRAEVLAGLIARIPNRGRTLLLLPGLADYSLQIIQYLAIFMAQKVDDRPTDSLPSCIHHIKSVIYFAKFNCY